MKEKEIKDRIRHIIKSKTYGSQKDITTKMGVAPGYISNIITSEIKGVPATLLKGLTRLGINGHWLITGEGKMFSDGSLKHLDDDYMTVPRFDLHINYDPTNFDKNAILDYSIFRKDWLSDTLNIEDPKNLILIQAEGESMYPTIVDGDNLLVDITKTENIKNDVYVIRINGSQHVKRIQVSLNGDLKVINDNPAFENETIPKDHIKLLYFIGRVVWMGKKM